MSKLVIVESPSKAKSIQKYLGKDYTVVSSKGHIRDLPAAKLSVDVKNDFAPKYMVIKGKGLMLGKMDNDNEELFIKGEVSGFEYVNPNKDKNNHIKK